MRQEIFDEYLHELETTNFPQCKDTLIRINEKGECEFCALGLFVQKFMPECIQVTKHSASIQWNQKYPAQSDLKEAYIELQSAKGIFSLSYLNDEANKSFKEIARYLRNHKSTFVSPPDSGTNDTKEQEVTK